MPLHKGSSQKVIGTNIRELHTGDTFAHTEGKFGKKRADKQAVAIALSTARKYRSSGGSAMNTKEEVNYREGYGGHRCANCTMYRNPHACTSVAGYIKPSDLCDLFQRKR